MCCRIAAAATQGIKMEHQLRFGGVEAAGSAAGGTAQLSGGQRTLLSLALILAVSRPTQCSNVQGAAPSMGGAAGILYIMSTHSKAVNNRCERGPAGQAAGLLILDDPGGLLMAHHAHPEQIAHACSRWARRRRYACAADRGRGGRPLASHHRET